MTLANNKFYFLSEEQARFFETLSEVMVPAGKDRTTSPGGIDVGGISYIDSTLLAFPKGVQDYFGEIVKLTNEKANRSFGKNFSELIATEKDRVLKDLFLDPSTREQAFDLRSLVLESFYSDYHDPDYNGITAWEAIKFEGKRISGIKKDWSFLKIWQDSQKKE